MTLSLPNKITIVGTGAMATLFAARLGGLAPVIMLGSWQEAVTAINTDGLTLNGRPGPRVSATTNPAHCAGSQFAIVLVKAWQTGRAATQIKTFLPDNGVALSLQNGLGNFETLVEQLGAERVALGTTTQGATLLGPGQVREGGRGVTHVAEHPQLQPLVDLLRAADFDIHQSPREASNLQSLIWGKLAINAAINPLTAILRVPNGELLNRPEALTLLDAAANEVAAVAQAKGIELPFANAGLRAREVAQATAQNRSSMFQDILRGAMTEVDAINGAVLREGIKVGVPAPMNDVFWRLVKSLEPQ
jgi:2-dehydropantoate 2-reductase